ncbi:hypothetical protein MHBO_004658, partial [Bonamia ostreae]
SENVPEDEKMMWRKEWLNCTKNLNEWDILFEFAQDSNNIELQFESSWRLSNWSYLRELCNIYEVEKVPKIRDVYCRNLKEIDL